MQHILQCAFDFDDEVIKKRLEDQCYREVRDKIYSDFKVMFAKKSDKYCSWGGEEHQKIYIEDALLNEVRNGIDRLIEKYKDEVIEIAAAKLAERLAKTKKAKELIQ